MNNDKELKFYKVKDGADGVSYIETEKGLAGLIDLLLDCEIGSGYTITRVRMSQAEFAGLPEFEGF